MKINKQLNNLINDFTERAHLPDSSSVSEAKIELSKISSRPYYIRKGILMTAWSFALIAVLVISAIAFNVFPPPTTYAENRGLEDYVTQTFSDEMNYSVTDCYDVRVGDTAAGAIINMIASPDERRGCDELRIIIEYSYSKYELAEKRFSNLPVYSLENSDIFYANISNDKDDFLTLATFLHENIRVCVEIRSTRSINLIEFGGFNDYMSIFAKWPSMIKNNL